MPRCTSLLMMRFLQSATNQRPLLIHDRFPFRRVNASTPGFPQTPAQPFPVARAPFEWESPPLRFLQGCEVAAQPSRPLAESRPARSLDAAPFSFSLAAVLFHSIQP